MGIYGKCVACGSAVTRWHEFDFSQKFELAQAQDIHSHHSAALWPSGSVSPLTHNCNHCHMEAEPVKEEYCHWGFCSRMADIPAGSSVGWLPGHVTQQADVCRTEEKLKSSFWSGLHQGLWDRWRPMLRPAWGRCLLQGQTLSNSRNTALLPHGETSHPWNGPGRLCYIRSDQFWYVCGKKKLIISLGYHYLVCNPRRFES